MTKFDNYMGKKIYYAYIYTIGSFGFFTNGSIGQINNPITQLVIRFSDRFGFKNIDK